MRQFSFRKSRRPHPVMLAAAASVITFSLLGVGAITGLIPSAYSNNAGNLQKNQLLSEPLINGGEAAGRAQAFCSSCGVVDSIRAVQVEGNASGVGAVAGGLTGAVVGNQIGNGHGRDAMTLLAGVGGAFAGHAVEKSINRHTVYRVTVRMDDGSFRTVSQSYAPTVVIGSKVRLANGGLVAQS